MNYSEKFIEAFKTWMIERKIDKVAIAARDLDIKPIRLYKVLDGTNNPTTELCIEFCQKAGISANWLFLDHGAKYLKDEMTLQNIANNLNMIVNKLG